jgi:hypothetical protein
MSSTEKATLSRLGEYILAWLLSQGEKRKTPSDITTGLKTALKDQVNDDAERRRAVDNEVAQLIRAGWIKRVSKIALQLTERGRHLILGALGWKERPQKANWTVVRKRYEACAAAHDAELLVHTYQLAVDPGSPLLQIQGALAWHAIGRKTNDPFTAESVIRWLINRLAGSSALLSTRKAFDLLVAKASSQAPSAPPAPKAAALPADDTAFAARVLAAARASKTGRFGDDKVFISHVLQRLAEEGAVVDDAEAFKVKLVSAHRRGLLSLNRADLVEAMDPADVSASETRYLSTTFHFVRI